MSHLLDKRSYCPMGSQVSRRRFLQLAAGGTASLTVGTMAQPDSTFSSQPTNWVVPFRAGGGTDQFARILQTKSEQYFGQRAVVQNRGGASGTIGWRYMLRQRQDAHTILFGSPSPVSAVLLERRPPFSPFDLRLVAYYSIARPIIFGGLDQPYDDWYSFVDHVRKHPGSVTVGGALAVLLSVLYVFKQLDLDVIYVPYPSTGATMGDFAGGHIDMAVGATGSISRMRSRANVIANLADVDISEKQRETLGDVFWVGSAGLEGLGTPRFLGVHPDTPDDLVDEVDQRFAALLADADINGQIEAQAEEIVHYPAAKASTHYVDFVRKTDLLLEELR